MTIEPTTAATPIACDMTGARDTAEQRIAEYGRLFARSLAGRERTGDASIRFLFRADEGVEEWVRDLAAREKACCPFFDFAVAAEGGQVRWDWSVAGDEVARTILDDIYHLPETVGDGIAGMEDRLTDRGLAVSRTTSGWVMAADPRQP